MQTTIRRGDDRNAPRKGGANVKFLVERDVLKGALSIAARQARGGAGAIPILSHVLLRAHDSTLTVVGHDLDSCSIVTIPAEVSVPGDIAVPADRLSKLIAGLADGSQITCDCDGKQAKLRAGRSNYLFPVLPAEDFPEVFTPENPVKIALTQKEVFRLFKLPAPCIGNDPSRVNLQGAYLHEWNNKLASCATDARALVRVSLPLKPPKFEPVIIPERACSEFVRICGDGEASLEITKNLIAIEHGNRRFVSKLIDATFPPYEKVIPSPTAVPMAVNAKDIDAAFARLAAASDGKGSPLVRLRWDDETQSVDIDLRTPAATGAEQIDCDSPGRPAGEVGMRMEDIQRVIEGMNCTRVRIIPDGPGDPVRFENPDDADAIGVVMPVRV
jgi:DNA polymerase-3 subunit beta